MIHEENPCLSNCDIGSMNICSSLSVDSKTPSKSNNDFELNLRSILNEVGPVIAIFDDSIVGCLYST